MGEVRRAGGRLLALPRPLAVSVLLVGAEAVTLLVLAVLQGVSIAGHRAQNLGVAVSFPVLLMLAAVALAATAFNLARCRRGARGPGIALNLCALVIAYYLLVGGLLVAGLLVGVGCLAVVALLLLPSTTKALGL